jgi:hypothetical protein
MCWKEEGTSSKMRSAMSHVYHCTALKGEKPDPSLSNRPWRRRRRRRRRKNGLMGISSESTIVFNIAEV